MVLTLFLVFFPLIVVLFGISVLMHTFYLVPFVPSKKKVIDQMLEAAELKKGEHVYDLGCGDGRLLRAAELKEKVRTTGYEIAPLVYIMARMRKFFWNSEMEIVFQSMYRASFKEANVIFCYLLPDAMKKLVEKFKTECQPGTRIVSQTFHIPGLEPSKVIPRDTTKGTPTVYVYSF